MHRAVVAVHSGPYVLTGGPGPDGASDDFVETLTLPEDEGQPHDNMPPFIALLFCQYVGLQSDDEPAAALDGDSEQE